MSTLPWRRAVPVMPMGRGRVPVPVMPMGWGRVPVPLLRGRGVTGLPRLSIPLRGCLVTTVASALIRRPIDESLASILGSVTCPFLPCFTVFHRM